MISCRRKEPYKMFSFEIGNEQKLDMLLVQQVQILHSWELAHKMFSRVSEYLFVHSFFRCNIRHQCMTAGTLYNTDSLFVMELGTPWYCIHPTLQQFLQVEAISKAMKQRAEDLQLPMPQLVVGQNIETWGQPSCVPVWNNTAVPWKNLGSISVHQLFVAGFLREMFDDSLISYFPLRRNHRVHLASCSNCNDATSPLFSPS